MSRGKIRALGIDFGTSNTAAAILTDSGATELLELDPSTGGDPRLLKSLLYFPTRRESFFGREAISQYFERDMEGRFFQSVKKLLPNSDFQGTIIHGSHVSVEELIARYLTDTRKRIEKIIGPLGEIPVFMGRPARYAQDPGKEGLAVVRFKTACDLAGFSRYRFIEEPSAAAKTYRSEKEKELILVIDLGGGTSDFTLMRVKNLSKKVEAGHTERTEFDIYSVHGISVAGDSLDSEFMNSKLLKFFGSDIRYQRPFSSNVLTMPGSLMKVLPKWHHHAFLRERSTWSFIQSLHKELVDPEQKKWLDNLITLVEDNLGYSLHQAVEKLKVTLSETNLTDFLFKSHPIAIQFPVSTQEFEDVLQSPVQQIKEAALETLRLGKHEPEKVEALYFTGGTSQVPIIRRTLTATFPNARVVDQDTFTSVASGLALSEP